MIFLLNTPFQKAHLQIPDFYVTGVTLVGAAVPGSRLHPGRKPCVQLGSSGTLGASYDWPQTEDSTRRAIKVASSLCTHQSDFGRSSCARQTDCALAGSQHLLCLAHDLEVCFALQVWG